MIKAFLGVYILKIISKLVLRFSGDCCDLAVIFESRRFLTLIYRKKTR